MFPFQLRLTPSASSPLEIKVWVLELLTVSYHGISPASWCATANIGSLFQSRGKSTFSGTGKGPSPHGSPAGQRRICSYSPASWKSLCMSLASVPNLNIRTTHITVKKKRRISSPRQKSVEKYCNIINNCSVTQQPGQDLSGLSL